ncbi:hypothetical protein [Persicobacter psychrovividus]
MCTYFTAIVIRYYPFLVELPPQVLNIKFVGIIFVITFLLPLAAIIVMKWSRKLVKALQMESKEERVMPFFFMTLFYGLTVYMLNSQWGLSGAFWLSIVMMAILLLLLSCITIFFKISAHSAGWGGLLGFIFTFQYITPAVGGLHALIFIFLCTGLAMTARLFLGAHSPKEIYSGWLLGFIVCAGGVMVFI